MFRIRMCGIHQVAYIGHCKKCEAEAMAAAKKEDEALRKEKPDCTGPER